MKWKSIGILGKPNAAEQNLDTFKELHQLLSSWQIPAHYEANVGKLLNLPDSACLSTENLFKTSDLILVVGGDGSMLNAARLSVPFQKPILGVNRGHLGFLTDIGPSELSVRLRHVLEERYWQESRFLLQGEIKHHDQTRHLDIALNDIVLSQGASSQLIEFELWINNTFVYRQRADGLIISTPTGSTAYSLSAGGPILHPGLPAIAIVPMLPHKLTSRPIVISNSVEIKIILTSRSQGPARVSFDSQRRIDMHGHETIYIRKHAHDLELIHPEDYNYFKTLRDKLHWESR
jgi:NAD+ kinase